MSCVDCDAANGEGYCHDKPEALLELVDVCTVGDASCDACANCQAGAMCNLGTKQVPCSECPASKGSASGSACCMSCVDCDAANGEGYCHDKPDSFSIVRQHK